MAQSKEQSRYPDEYVPVSLTDKAYDTVQRRIVHLDLPPGQTFTENELVAELGMSKTPLREALRVLQMQGFVKASPRAGWVISPITLGDAQHLYDMRRMLEPEAARLAAERGMSDTHVKKMREWSNLTVDTRDRRSLDVFLEAYGHFPVLVAANAGNPRLSRALHEVCISLERCFRVAMVMFEPQQKVTDHWKMLMAALIDGDAARAKLLVEENIRDERRMVIDALIQSDAVQQTNVGDGSS